MANVGRANVQFTTYDIFIHELLKGKSQRQAYLKAYPHRKNWNPNSLDCEASKLFNKPKVKQRYDEMLAKMREEEQKKTQWTREESIKTLKYVIEKNVEDLERLAQTTEQELEALLVAINENPERAPELTASLLKLQKARRVSATHNQGIVIAVAELNKMQGFNEENINLSGTVVFAGESDLEE